MACSQSQMGSDTQTAAGCLEEAEAALANDSIRLGETLLRKTIRLAEESEDWHTNYIAYQRLAEALSQSNPEEALRLMKKALTIYEQHPDDERNNVILLDYAGTYASQVAFTTEGSFDEALEFVNKAYDIAKKNQMTDLMCQTLTSLANIAWANEVVTFLQNFILERTEAMKKLNQSGDSLIYLSPHEWNEVERTLNAIDNNRFATIREQYPNMQEDDIRLCLLTRLGISNRVIGNIYCITISAVQHRKLKLKKDVFGETNPDITLEQILTGSWQAKKQN